MLWVTLVNRCLKKTKKQGQFPLTPIEEFCAGYIGRKKKEEKNTRNSGLPKLLRWLHALRPNQLVYFVSLFVSLFVCTGIYRFLSFTDNQDSKYAHLYDSLFVHIIQMSILIFFDKIYDNHTLFKWFVRTFIFFIATI
jgi:hypothetical protein